MKFTIKEIATIIGESRGAVQNWTTQGIQKVFLKFSRHGEWTKIVDASDLEKFLMKTNKIKELAKLHTYLHEKSSTTTKQKTDQEHLIKVYANILRISSDGILYWIKNGIKNGIKLQARKVTISFLKNFQQDCYVIKINDMKTFLEKTGKHELKQKLENYFSENLDEVYSPLTNTTQPEPFIFLHANAARQVAIKATKELHKTLSKVYNEILAAANNEKFSVVVSMQLSERAIEELSKSFKVATTKNGKNEYLISW